MKNAENHMIEDDEGEEELPIDLKDEQIVLDLRFPIEQRLTIFKNLPREKYEMIINQLIGMYEFSNASLIKKYLIELCSLKDLDSVIRCQIAQSLCLKHTEDDFPFTCLQNVYPDLIGNISIPYLIDVLRLMMKNPNFKDFTKSELLKIINNINYSNLYRVRIISSLENETDKEYFLDCCKSFSFEEKNEINYRIITCQYCLINQSASLKIESALPTINSIVVESILELLYKFGNDTNIVYNTRADCADMLVKFGDDKFRKLGQKLIYELGKNGKKVKTIYDNAQNVHTQSVEKSIETGLQFLATIPTLRINDSNITFDYVDSEIKKRKNNENIEISLNRINLDRAQYGELHMTLCSTLIKLWSYIQAHEHRETLENRLIEELEHMSGSSDNETACVCSSGLITNLINSISGFGDFEMKISFEDQIIANFIGRMNAKLKAYKDADDVLEEIISRDGSLRKKYNEFIISSYSTVKEELWREFSSFITNGEFDIYLRKAIISFEGEN